MKYIIHQIAGAACRNTQWEREQSKAFNGRRFLPASDPRLQEHQQRWEKIELALIAHLKDVIYLR